MTLVELRCHERLDLRFEAPLVVLDGDNGAGKTTVLEALSLVCALKSFRGSSNRELLKRDGSGTARVSARMVNDGLVRDLELTLNARGRSMRVDGKRPESLSGWFRHAKCVSFSPEDPAMIRGAPELRRAFVDRACFTFDPTHLERVRAFKKALDQRNAALRQGLSGAELAVWTEAFIAVANKVRRARERTLEVLLPVAVEAYDRLSGGADGGLRIRIDPSGGPDLRGALEQSATLERRRKTTQAGPQRDGVVFLLGDLDLRSQGSQGQVRSAALAAKSAVLRAAAERTGVRPLLLLDDVGSELDPKRNAALLDLVRDVGCQTFISTTDRRLLPLPEQELQCIRIRPDRVESGAGTG